MDDDQQIDSSYLSRVVPCFEKTRADCIGGWVGYVDAEQFPRWLKTLVARMGTRDLGRIPHPIGASDDPKLGAGNMAMRKSMFESVGGFRTDLKQAEDLELQERDFEGRRAHSLRAGFASVSLSRTAAQDAQLLSSALVRGRTRRMPHRRTKMAIRAAPLGVPRFLWGAKIAKRYLSRTLAPSSFRPGDDDGPVVRRGGTAWVAVRSRVPEAEAALIRRSITP